MAGTADDPPPLVPLHGKRGAVVPIPEELLADKDFRQRVIIAEVLASKFENLSRVEIKPDGTIVMEGEKKQVAEDALRTPERVLLFNMTLLVVLLGLGATALQYLTLTAFVLLTGFILSAVVVVNAFYLRSIDKLRDESFMELIKLALLKFFAPLTRKGR
jgi:hypothetical protein